MGSEVPILRQPPQKKSKKNHWDEKPWLKMAYGSEAFAKSLGFCIVSVDGVSDNRTSNLRSHGRKLGDIFPRGLSFPFRGGCVYIYIYLYEYSPVNQHSYGKWPSYR